MLGFHRSSCTVVVLPLMLVAKDSLIARQYNLLSKVIPSFYHAQN